MSLNLKEFGDEYVVTPFINNIIERTIGYMQAGLAVHFCGSAGTGKTTLALIAASALNQPIVVTYGNDDFSHTDLIGSVAGFKKQVIRDNYVHSVFKSTDVFNVSWLDGAITKACKNGYTLIYDEFTRSRPEANNVLLSVLEEKVLHLPNVASGEKEIQVHPNFRVIFTSNPEEYAGIHKSQDALRDRIITLDLRDFDLETEKSIILSRSGVSEEEAAKINLIVRSFRNKYQDNFRPTVRAGIMIGRTVKRLGLPVSSQNERFRQTCQDVLLSSVLPEHYKAQVFKKGAKAVKEIIDEFCP